MAAIMINDNLQNNDDDDATQSLLNKPAEKRSKTHNKYNKKIKIEKPTFSQWLFSKPLSKLPFLYFIIGILAVPALAVFHFMDPDISFIICGGFIALNVFAYRHFYTLIGLKKQVDEFGGLNRKFGREHKCIAKEVNKISIANDRLRSAHNRIQIANKKNRENLGQFAQLQETMKQMNLQSVDELTSIVSKANGIGDSWQKQLINHERDMLHTVFDRFELASGKSGMTQAEFREFSKQLPDTYQNRFARLGTFEQMSTDGQHIKFSDFDAALDVFAEMDAMDCDIEFEIEKTDTERGNAVNDSDYIPQSTLEVIPSKEDWGDDISDMKLWKTVQKKYDNVNRKIIIRSKSYRSIKAKAFTSSLGFDVLNEVDEENEENKESDETDYEESDYDENNASFSGGGSVRSDGAFGLRHMTIKEKASLVESTGDK